MKTRVYSEGIFEEAVYFLAEWLSSLAVHGSISFPEIIIPVMAVLRKTLKASRTSLGPGSGKNQNLVKVHLERVEESGHWVEHKRKDVCFAPRMLGDVEEWEMGLNAAIEDSPLGKYVKVLRKTREKRRRLVQKVRVITIRCAFEPPNADLSDHPIWLGS